MKKFRNPSMWLMFTVSVLAIFLLTCIIMIAIAGLMFRQGYLVEPDTPPFTPVIVLLFFSAILGAIFSLVGGRKIRKPVESLTLAFSEVAKGNFSVSLSEDAKVAEMRGIARDFNFMVSELSSIETLRTDFVTNVSHEFKTPLAAIEGYAALLQDNSLSNEERREYTKMIIDSSRELSALTENILKLSKLEQQECTADKSSFRLDEQIREAVLMLERQWSEKNISVEIDLPRLVYYGDKGLLMQVWVNLIANAVKFTDAGGRISMSARSTPSSITVIVSDNGRGIGEGELRHIFDKFYQGDKARNEAGNGLGLALVKRIVDLCGGEISAESRVDEGSVFSVTLECKWDSTTVMR